ncbi:putative YhdH/YhfP family quinone oxidoreductase [Natronobacillus azotifigens]|uniref:Acryloyl-CoA reductase n=1 Tax=Natronobacillus azotifigens TaxID=472978 RepID=A0A9J6RA91_9BACI|nr:acryloyl-CoA reductase [Natronobacillus azotifigens]MCZ0702455.1 acryloyl-CoA reductase [Natronobacillus azotifigens]
MDQTIKAYRLMKESDQVIGKVIDLTVDDLPEGEVLVRVHYSGINYKDSLANLTNSPIVKNYPFTPGIDLAGEVVESADDRFSPGDPVIATSYEIGVTHDGGYSEYARLKAEWVLPLPDGLTLKKAMILGTAGFTAALSIDQLEKSGLTPEAGKVLVTGATGGVGSIAATMLANNGYHVVASSGKDKAETFLNDLGVKETIDRDAVVGGKIRALDKQLWAGAVDPVGGETLAAILSKLQYNGAVAVSGLAGGVNVPTTVHPFILRGIRLIGIDSVYCPYDYRREIWERMSRDLSLSDKQYSTISTKEIGLNELGQYLPTLLETKTFGRLIVKIK